MTQRALLVYILSYKPFAVDSITLLLFLPHTPIEYAPLFIDTFPHTLVC
jgi:hypothetical protein